jgi:hypothetical protein
VIAASSSVASGAARLQGGVGRLAHDPRKLGAWGGFSAAPRALTTGGPEIDQVGSSVAVGREHFEHARCTEHPLAIFTVAQQKDHTIRSLACVNANARVR